MDADVVITPFGLSADDGGSTPPISQSRRRVRRGPVAADDGDETTTMLISDVVHQLRGLALRTAGKIDAVLDIHVASEHWGSLRVVGHDRRLAPIAMRAIEDANARLSAIHPMSADNDAVLLHALIAAWFAAARGGAALPAVAHGLRVAAEHPVAPRYWLRNESWLAAIHAGMSPANVEAIVDAAAGAHHSHRPHNFSSRCYVWTPIMDNALPTPIPPVVAAILREDGSMVSDLIALMRAHVGLMHQAETLTELREQLDAVKNDMRLLFIRVSTMNDRVTAAEKEREARIVEMIREAEAHAVRERHPTRRTTDLTVEEELASATPVKPTAAAMAGPIVPATASVWSPPSIPPMVYDPSKSQRLLIPRPSATDEEIRSFVREHGLREGPEVRNRMMSFNLPTYERMTERAAQNDMALWEWAFEAWEDWAADGYDVPAHIRTRMLPVHNHEIPMFMMEYVATTAYRMAHEHQVFPVHVLRAVLFDRFVDDGLEQDLDLIANDQYRVILRKPIEPRMRLVSTYRSP